MNPTLRMFIAIETSPAIHARAVELTRKLRPAPVDVKWVEPENLHLTLKFLGDVPATEIANVIRAVQGAAATIEPFDLELRAAGAFPDAGRPRTLWIGAGDGDAEAAKLAEAVDKALDPLGFPREHRKFQTHLTIGRVRTGGSGLAELGRLLKQHSDFEAGRMEVDELVIFSSELTRTGPIYEALGRAELGG